MQRLLKIEKEDLYSITINIYIYILCGNFIGSSNKKMKPERKITFDYYG